MANTKTTRRIKPIKLEMINSIEQGDYGNLNHLLSEGVSANVFNGSLLNIAAQHGDTRIMKLLLKNGAKIRPSMEVPLLGAPVGSAAPEALQLLIDRLGQETTEKALRRHEYAVVVLAGDVCRKAKYYQAKKVKLTIAEVNRRRDELLGDALRFSFWKLNEPFELAWMQIVERSVQCARILRDAIEPTSEKDMSILEEWLDPHLD